MVLPDKHHMGKRSKQEGWESTRSCSGRRQDAPQSGLALHVTLRDLLVLVAATPSHRCPFFRDATSPGCWLHTCVLGAPDSLCSRTKEQVTSQLFRGVSSTGMLSALTAVVPLSV